MNFSKNFCLMPIYSKFSGRIIVDLFADRRIREKGNLDS